MKPAAADVRKLARLLEALEQELIEASDEEILEAAKDLRMDPGMKESAAFIGLKVPAKPQLSDFFEFDLCRRLQLEKDAKQLQPKRKPRASKRPVPIEKKNPDS
jgi:hypothetical protein